MCGIAGLFIKDSALEPQLGALLSGMMRTLGDRGPDSAGFAVYGRAPDGQGKITVQSADPQTDFAGLAEALEAALGVPVALAPRDTHAVLTLPLDKLEQARAALRALRPSLRFMGAGERIEIYKEVGRPVDVTARFDLAHMAGTHGIGHTRMATESAVTTLGAHPFSTGADECLVHNGSLSNHNNLRRMLRHDGMAFETENDTEVAAAYLSWRMHQGMGLGEALETSLADLDGFYTFVVGTKDGFGVLRDPVACKPAVLAETDRYVAFGSEYRALTELPDIENARVWEPEPATVYFWGALSVRRVDLGETSLRELNEALHRQTAGTNETEWQVVNPKGQHAVAVAVDAPITVTVEGSVGYYCAGMNKQATILVRGSAGPGVAENMMSGEVRVTGDASQYAGATAQGGLLVIEGNAASRCGISMKGIDIVVKGSIGHMSAFMAQSGNLVVCGDAGEALGDSIYEARLFVRGEVKSLGADCIEKPMRPEHLRLLADLLARAGIEADAASFRRYGSARKLYNFNLDHADAYG